MLRDKTILIIGTEPWFGPLLSKHHVALELSKYNTVFYLDPVYHVGSLLRLKWPSYGYDYQYHVHKPNTLKLMKPWWLPKTTSSKTMQLFARQFFWLQIRHLGTQADLVISFDPTYAWLKSFIDVPLIYYCVDTQFDRSQEPKMLKQADMVVVATRKLYEEFKHQTTRLEYLAHGINLKMYIDAAVEIPNEFTDIPHPIGGYVGSVNNHLNIDLLEDIAKVFPNLSIVLVGPYASNDFGGGLDSQKLGRLRKYHNIYLLGPKPSDQLGAYINQFDIGIIPYDLKHLRIHFSYHKILQYLALGKPIVSTVKPINETLPSLVRIGEETNSYIEAIEVLLAENSSIYVKEAYQFASQHSWMQRIDQLSQWLESYGLLTRQVDM